jgi:hypothetical protein
VIDEGELQGVKGGKNSLHRVKRKASSIGHVLRRICLLKHVIEGKVEGRIEVTEIRDVLCFHV